MFLGASAIALILSFLSNACKEIDASTESKDPIGANQTVLNQDKGLHEMIRNAQQLELSQALYEDILAEINP